VKTVAKVSFKIHKIWNIILLYSNKVSTRCWKLLKTKRTCTAT